MFAEFLLLPVFFPWLRTCVGSTIGLIFGFQLGYFILELTLSGHPLCSKLMQGEMFLTAHTSILVSMVKLTQDEVRSWLHIFWFEILNITYECPRPTNNSPHHIPNSCLQIAKHCRCRRQALPHDCFLSSVLCPKKLKCRVAGT